MPATRPGATAAQTEPFASGSDLPPGDAAPAPLAAQSRDHERSLRDHARSLRDHEAITRLADDLLPALIARLSSSGLAEIEVREGSWKARLRKPVAEARAVRVVDHVHAYASTRPAGAHRDERDRHILEEPVDEEPGITAATSPAVGIFTPRRDLAVGMPVRSGDRIGTVDVLGVGHEVVAPVDGVIGISFVETGEAVEYGQELVRIELPEKAAATSPAGETAALAGRA
jgi:acetyl-CoA carboxylase biotin carboxyl carrier protein